MALKTLQLLKGMKKKRTTQITMKNLQKTIILTIKKDLQEKALLYQRKIEKIQNLLQVQIITL